MLESRWDEGGGLGGLDLKEMESCGTNMSAVVLVCCFLQSKHNSHLLEKQMSALKCIQKVTWHSFHTALIKISPPGCSCRYICYLDTIDANSCYNEVWCHLVRLEKLGFLELSDYKKKECICLVHYLQL